MSKYIDSKWSKFYKELPHKEPPFSKKNWGHPNHSLCSYQGKLKPAIAHHLVKTFVPQGGSLFDPFAGVGTIPFEAALNGKVAYGMDISPLAYYVSNAKLHRCTLEECQQVLNNLQEYINTVQLPQDYINTNSQFGFNKSLSEYYNERTFLEILASRAFFHENVPHSPAEMMVISSLLHILHGNRPYALSRKSHPIVPYAPTGESIYKNLIQKVSEKVERAISEPYPKHFAEGEIYLRDSTLEWPDEINEIDAIITSPPFYDSTRFYLANWIRLWFTGWNQEDFDVKPAQYVDERQKDSFDVYDRIFQQAKDRLANGGYFVMHLGKSDKCDMGKVLQQRAKKWFSRTRLYDESVAECAKFGIADLGGVTSHEYLIME